MQLYKIQPTTMHEKTKNRPKQNIVVAMIQWEDKDFPLLLHGY